MDTQLSCQEGAHIFEWACSVNAHDDDIERASKMTQWCRCRDVVINSRMLIDLREVDDDD
jgi:hypothetical protein